MCKVRVNNYIILFYRVLGLSTSVLKWLNVSVLITIILMVCILFIIYNFVI